MHAFYVGTIVFLIIVIVVQYGYYNCLWGVNNMFPAKMRHLCTGPIGGGGGTYNPQDTTGGTGGGVTSRMADKMLRRDGY
jgi:hypothetical protein